MKSKQISQRKKWLVAGGIVLLILAILAGAFLWYVSDYYRAEDVALEVMAQDNGITVRDNLTILSPTYPTDTTIIFYPGAKVEAEATCLCWTRSDKRESPVFWYICRSAWRSLTPTRRKK